MHALVSGSPYPLSDFRAVKGNCSRRMLSASIATSGNALTLRRATASTTTARRNANVVGVGIAEKIVDGKPTGILAVKFFVRTKFPKGDVPKAQQLPASVDGLPTDVDESGTFHAFAKATRRARAPRLPNPRARHRPFAPGCSIGFRIAGDEAVMTGTFGALVKVGRTRYLLSNNHVLADENRLPLRSPIYQPALMDRGRVTKDQVAELTRFIKLQKGRYNRVDAAIARLVRTNLVERDVLHIGGPTGGMAAALDMTVHKFGRTTGYTVGRVTSIDTDVSVEYETADFTFESQVVIRGSGSTTFSDSGDSGSLILERTTNAAVALLFGGSAKYTLANHIGRVLQSLRVKLA